MTTEKIKTALLIEDDVMHQKIVSRYLEQLNFIVDSALDGLIGIQKVLSNHYHLIITDLSLPHHSGVEVISAVRQSKSNKQTHLILVSAQLNKPELHTYLDLGVNAVFIKPIFFKDLAKVISQF